MFKNQEITYQIISHPALPPLILVWSAPALIMDLKLIHLVFGWSGGGGSVGDGCGVGEFFPRRKRHLESLILKFILNRTYVTDNSIIKTKSSQTMPVFILNL